MSHVIVRHVKSLLLSPGPHTCVHVAHTMRCFLIKKIEREGGGGGRERGRERGKEEGREGGKEEGGKKEE